MKMMKPLPIKVVGCIVLLILSLSFVCSQPSFPREPPPYKLTQMKVVPISQRTGLFLAEIKKDVDFSAWNELNLSLFVTIEISGKAGEYTSRRNVEIVAYEGSRLIVKQVARIGVLDEPIGKYFVPVLLHGPFCQQVTIKARITGQTRSSTLQRKLYFQCGE